MFYLCTDTQKELDVWLLKFQEHIAYADISAAHPDQHVAGSRASMNGPPLPPPLQPMRNIGDQVEVEFFDEGEYDKGVITFVHQPHLKNKGVFEDGSYDILFDDGDYRENVLENELRQEPEELLPPPLASNGGLEMNRFIFVKKKNSSILLLNTNPTPPTLPPPLPDNLPPPPQPPSIA